jgi:hypothetical protein
MRTKMTEARNVVATAKLTITISEKTNALRKNTILRIRVLALGEEALLPARKYPTTEPPELNI